MDVVRRCPKCNSEDILPILYGLPGPEMTEESIRGRVALGGCVVFPDAPDHTCRNCGHDWREDDAGS